MLRVGRSVGSGEVDMEVIDKETGSFFKQCLTVLFYHMSMNSQDSPLI